MDNSRSYAMPATERPAQEPLGVILVEILTRAEELEKRMGTLCEKVEPRPQDPQKLGASTCPTGALALANLSRNALMRLAEKVLFLENLL